MNWLFDDLLTLNNIFRLIGLLLWVFAWLTWCDRRHKARFLTGLYWFLLGGVFLVGDELPTLGKIPYEWYSVIGGVVIVLVVLDAVGKVQTGSYEVRPSQSVAVGQDREIQVTQDLGLWTSDFGLKLGNRIFLPVLTIPVITFLCAGVFRFLGRDVATGAVVGLGVSGIAAAGVALGLTRSTVVELCQAGRKVTEEIGALNILPQLLASLGSVFTAAGVGSLLAGYVSHVVPTGEPLVAGIAYFMAMMLFTAVMGNSFAAFAVITTGIGIPLLIAPFHLDAAVIGILGLTAGSCGTLTTPMAANFNILPASLYEMKDTYGVIRFQWRFAVALWITHVALLWAWLRFFD